MKIAEFVAEIMLKGGGKAIQDIRKISAGIKDLRLGLVSALQSFDQISAAAREVAVNLDKYQLNTGLSAVQLQKLSFQAVQAGVSMKELGDTIQKLQQKNANARLGYGWDPVLTRFGLHPGQDPVTQLNKIGSALRRMQATNPAEAKSLAARAGISDNMYYAILRGSTEEMDKQFIITQKEQTSLVKLNQQWNKFWFYIKQITVKFQVLSANLQTRFLKVLLNASKGFLELLTRAHDLVEANDKLKYAVIALGVALTAYFAPWLLLLGAVALVLEDIWGYFEGKDSVTGRIIEWVKNSERLKSIWEGIKLIFYGVKNALKPLIYLFQLQRKEMEIISDLINSNPILSKIISSIGEAAMKAIDLANPLTALENLGNLAEMIKPSGVSNNSSVTINQTNTAYVESTGDAVQDAQNVAAFRNEQLIQAQGQMPNRANGNKKGGLIYN